jgi:hypothetical protein
VVTRLLALLLALHPLHTTMTELTVDVATHRVRARTRVFAEDFRRASHGSASPAAYVASSLSILDASRRAITLRDCGMKQTGDLLWICVEGQFSGDGSALAVSDALLCELFEDQVNIVQVVTGSDRRSLLFVKGDRAKRAR